MAHFGSQPPLLCVIDEGLDHVTHVMGGQERLELHLAAVDVPLGEVGVLLAPLGRVDLAVAPVVAAVHVGDDVREEERVVQRGVEGVLLGRGAPRIAMRPS